MAKVEYRAIQLPVESIEQLDFINEKEEKIISSFLVNSTYDQNIHNIELHILDQGNTLLFSEPKYDRASQLLNAAGAGKQGASNITLVPIEDALKYSFDGGDVKVLYHFTKDLYSTTKNNVEFFIESISPDRTEIRALTKFLDDSTVLELTEQIVTKLQSDSFFSELKLNFKENVILDGINITTENTSKGTSVVLKLYEPLAVDLGINSTFSIQEFICDSALFEIQSTFEDEKVKIPFLKGPNFNVEVTDNLNNPSEYFNYNELFSYPVTSSYYELRSLFNEKSAQIAIDHTDYSDFIHFSSAEERLRNFKYKLDLINSYQDSIDSIKNTGYTQTGISGSLTYYQNLIEGVVNNFDHYDRYLYYESGSYSWPKTNTSRPYLNQASTTSEAITWYTSQLSIASNYDDTNFDILTNTIPTFLREDSNNEPYLMFIHMIAQHFDNLWIYFKAVSDKYDADNRLSFGVSKDLVRHAVEGLGIRLYDSNQNLENLFSMFIGESFATGSELINTTVTATSGSGLEYLQPVPKDNYLKEVYKRIYHNIPTIVKSKGTERGLRALINSFGIPSDVLYLKMFGGKSSNSYKYVGPFQAVTSSLDKVRLDNTGSIVTGSTLSRYTSIVERDNKYSDDLHTVEVGFDISTITNNHFISKISSSFNIDNYIGDPGINYESEYGELDQLYQSIYGQGNVNWEDIITNWENANWNWDEALVFFREPSAIIRLIKFFDNSIFRIIKDFLPARTSISTGAVIKSHILHRSKAKQVQTYGSEHVFTSSLQTAFISGSDGKAFGVANKTPYTTNYSASFVTPLGTISRDITDESPRITGEFSGSLLIASDKELNLANPFKKALQPQITFDLNFYNLSQPIPPACTITLSGSYDGEYFTFTPVSGNGTIGISYPTTVAASTSAFNYTVNFDVYEFISATATATYPYSFDGWYTQASGGSLISTDPTIAIYNEDEATNGYQYYARFS